MQDGVPTTSIKIRFHIIYPINSHGITSLYLLLLTNPYTMSMTNRNNQNKKDRCKVHYLQHESQINLAILFFGDFL